MKTATLASAMLLALTSCALPAASGDRPASQQAPTTFDASGEINIRGAGGWASLNSTPELFCTIGQLPEHADVLVYDGSNRAVALGKADSTEEISDSRRGTGCRFTFTVEDIPIDAGLVYTIDLQGIRWNFAQNEAESMSLVYTRP